MFKSNAYRINNFIKLSTVGGIVPLREFFAKSLQVKKKELKKSQVEHFFLSEKKIAFSLENLLTVLLN